MQLFTLITHLSDIIIQIIMKFQHQQVFYHFYQHDQIFGAIPWSAKDVTVLENAKTEEFATDKTAINITTFITDDNPEILVVLNEITHGDAAASADDFLFNNLGSLYETNKSIIINETK